MALYDNKHWLLSHIRNSFITSDDSGNVKITILLNCSEKKALFKNKFQLKQKMVHVLLLCK